MEPNYTIQGPTSPQVTASRHLLCTFIPQRRVFFLFGFWSAIGTSPSQPTPPLLLHFPPWLSSFFVPFSQLGPYAGHDDHHISFLLSYVTCWHYNVPRLAINTTRKKEKKECNFPFYCERSGMTRYSLKKKEESEIFCCLSNILYCRWYTDWYSL